MQSILVKSMVCVCIFSHFITFFHTLFISSNVFKCVSTTQTIQFNWSRHINLCVIFRVWAKVRKKKKKKVFLFQKMYISLHIWADNRIKKAQTLIRWLHVSEKEENSCLSGTLFKLKIVILWNFFKSHIFKSTGLKLLYLFYNRQI